MIVIFTSTRGHRKAEKTIWIINRSPMMRLHHLSVSSNLFVKSFPANEARKRSEYSECTFRITAPGQRTVCSTKCRFSTKVAYSASRPSTHVLNLRVCNNRLTISWLSFAQVKHGELAVSYLKHGRRLSLSFSLSLAIPHQLMGKAGLILPNRQAPIALANSVYCVESRQVISVCTRWPLRGACMARIERSFGLLLSADIECLIRWSTIMDSGPIARRFASRRAMLAGLFMNAICVTHGLGNYETRPDSC